MADLISSLADQIVALINSSPRSPTKEEIARVLDRALVASPFVCKDCGGPPGERRPGTADSDVNHIPAFCKTCGYRTHAPHSRMPIMPLPYKDVSADLMKLLESLRADICYCTVVPCACGAVKP